MKINIKVTHILGFMLSVIILSSCNYLDVAPVETASFKDVMKDRSSIIDFLYSCYSGIPSASEYDTPWKLYYSSADEYALPPLYGKAAQVMAWGEISSTNTAWGLPWTECYDRIGYCHLFIKALNEYCPNDSNITESDKTRWKGEIYFLQAFYHNVLLNSYGPIPLVTKWYSENTSKGDLPGRSPYDVCVDSISAWYDKAASMLPATVDEDELGRATSTACKALKARLLLYAASPLWNGSFPYPNWENNDGKKLVDQTYDATKWQKALDACNDAINLAIGDGDRSLFDMATSEMIRKAQNVPLPTIVNEDSTFEKRVMLMRYLMTTTEDQGNKEVIYGNDNGDLWAVEGYAAPHHIVTHNGSPCGGCSAMAPYLYTMEHFYTANGKLPENDHSFYPESEWLTSAGLSNSDIIKLNVNREPRYYAWLSFDGDTYSAFLANGSPFVIQAKNSNQAGYNSSLYSRDFSATGFFMKKWIQPNLKFSSSTGSANYVLPPYPIIRLAELYLNRAECYAELGETSKALADLNVIRERAGISDLTTADITSDVTLMDWVRNERFVELWGEGQRYYDLRRWCLAPQYLKAGVRKGLNAQVQNPSFANFNQITNVNQNFEWLTRMYLLPVASAELYSDPQLVQAPGY